MASLWSKRRRILLHFYRQLEYKTVKKWAKGTYVTLYRSAVTGRFVDFEWYAHNPGTTIKQRIRLRRKKSGKFRRD